MSRSLRITASILSLDPSRMAEEVATIAEKVDAIQLDIMDGQFVSHTTYGAEIVSLVRTTLPLDVHLMVVNPADRIDAFANAGVSHITFHAEAVADRHAQERLVAAIRSKGCTAGIAINPHTHHDAIQTMDIDLVLCMTVHPGKGGQQFIESVLPKIASIRSQHPDISIQVDGGINEETARACIAAGADNLVIGTALFAAPDPLRVLDRIRHETA